MKHLKKSIACLILALVMAVSSVPGASLMGAGFETQAAQKAQKKKYSLNKTIKHLNRNSRFVLKVQGGAKSVKWSTTDKKVASVRKKSKNKAVVTAKSAGTCKIFAKAGGITMSCVVQVTDSTKKAGTFKKGAYYIGKTKVYTVKKALSTEGGDLDFNGAKYLYIGASRTKNTANAVKDPEVYFYHYSGCGIDCLFRRMFSDNRWKAAGLKLIDSFLEQQPTGTVLIDLGGNDLRNISAYVNLYKTLIRTYPAADFRFIGVLPRQDGTNKKRVKFNKQLKKAFPSRVIDLFSYVLALPQFDTVDGVHYAPVLSRIIYEQMMRSIGRNITVDLNTGVVINGILTPEDEYITPQPEIITPVEDDDPSGSEGGQSGGSSGNEGGQGGSGSSGNEGGQEGGSGTSEGGTDPSPADAG